VARDIDSRYVGSMESSLMNVYLGQTAAGAAWPPPWRALSRQRPELARELEVKWETEHLINIGVVALPEVPEGVVHRVRDLLIGLQDDSRGREVLALMGLGRFEPATDATYQPVRDFLARFAGEVRPLDQP
jgi:phosphonate transport system substrate-binding protein